MLGQQNELWNIFDKWRALSSLLFPWCKIQHWPQSMLIKRNFPARKQRSESWATNTKQRRWQKCLACWMFVYVCFLWCWLSFCGEGRGGNWKHVETTEISTNTIKVIKWCWLRGHNGSEGKNISKCHKVVEGPQNIAGPEPYRWTVIIFTADRISIFHFFWPLFPTG